MPLTTAKALVAQNRVSSTPLPNQRWSELRARGAHRVTAQPPLPVIDARGSLEAGAAPPAQASGSLSPPRAPRPPTQPAPAVGLRTPGVRKEATKWNRSSLLHFSVAAAGKNTISKIKHKESIRRIKTQSPLPSALGWQTGPVFSDPRIQPLLHELFRPVGILCIFFMNTCFK